MKHQIQKISFICLCLAASVVAAPTDTPAGQASLDTTTTPKNAASSATTTRKPTTTALPTSVVDQTSSAPTPGDPSKVANTTASMAVSSTNDENINSSSFSCYGRSMGYYADIEHNCKVYHFCLLGDYNGAVVYQRISYLCLEETVFDQQAFDCVSPSKVHTPCKESQSHYDLSNAILRAAVIDEPWNAAHPKTNDVTITG